MEIKIARHSGICFGVKRALNLTQQALKTDKKVYSLGDLIHNPRVVNQLSRRGLKNISDIKSIKQGTVVVRSHGAHPTLIEKIKKKKLKLVNATCPFVSSIQKICRSLKKDGYKVIIVGDYAHPEVKALLGNAGDDALVIDNEKEIPKLKSKSVKIGVVAQTTQSQTNYLKVIRKLIEGGFSEVRIFNTICKDTIERQRSARELAERVDVMLVVGGKISANTKRLADICKIECVDTHHIEEPDDIDRRWIKGKKKVGISSGASTPQEIIRETIRKLKIL